MIGRLPRPKRGFTLPNHLYTGPYNPLHLQLDENDHPIPGQEPFNSVDEISMRHDICYRDHGNEEGGKHACDDEMLKELDILEPANVREKIEKKLVRTIIGKKRKHGLGIVGGRLWENELADELHKPIRRKFRKRRVFASGVDAIWAADLADMQNYEEENQGYRFILMVIDIFSKYGWAVPLKFKSGPEIVRAFRHLWQKQKPQRLWTDRGSEFKNKDFAQLRREYDVQLYFTDNEEKSCVVERWIRTIKRNMWKYFTANNTWTYTDMLPELVDKYNHTYHRSIECTPADARDVSNYQHVFDALYPPQGPSKQTFQIGDHVRMVRLKDKFEKGFTPNWTQELYIIKSVKTTTPITYTLVDLRGEDVEGSFYPQELQKAKQEIYRIEKVIKRRTRRGKKELYVKWMGYRNDFNSWIPDDDEVVNYES